MDRSSGQWILSPVVTASNSRPWPSPLLFIFLLHLRAVALVGVLCVCALAAAGAAGAVGARVTDLLPFSSRFLSHVHGPAASRMTSHPHPLVPLGQLVLFTWRTNVQQRSVTRLDIIIVLLEID